MRRAAVAALAVAVLGAACTQDRSAGDGSAGPMPRCEALPGRGVEGFVLERTRELDEGDRIATRRDYRDRRGRLLVYLLGLSGEIGEGLPFLGPVTLAGGERARFLGRRTAWMVVWEGAFPCPQLAVVGNGFRKEEFVRLLVEAGLLPPAEATPLLGTDLTEWVAVFHTSPDLVDLDEDTDALLELVPEHIIVGPVGCHRGLPRALGVEDDASFSGVVAESESELDEAIDRAARSPLFADGPVFRGELEVLCLGD
ncbi:MAG: hypothetical protein ACRDH1_11325 [Actinomycetota bacterium]